MYGAELAEVYEIVFRHRGKDWETEAKLVESLIRARRPDAESILDVACGTGIHLAALRKSFQHSEGVEISDPMRRLAAERLPGIAVHDNDMRDFDLGREFDAVTCLFSAIGYVPTVEDLRKAIGGMARHLTPGGVLVVEPWWFPDDFIDGYVAADVAWHNGMAISRVSHSTRKGNATRMETRFTVADSDGIRDFTEIDVISLFTEEEYRTAFTLAGCALEHVQEGPTARGLFVGVRGG